VLLTFGIPAEWHGLLLLMTSGSLTDVLQNFISVIGMSAHADLIKAETAADPCLDCSHFVKRPRISRGFSDAANQIY
jgi:hypothetical protein